MDNVQEKEDNLVSPLEEKYGVMSSLCLLDLCDELEDALNKAEDNGFCIDESLKCFLALKSEIYVMTNPRLERKLDE